MTGVVANSGRMPKSPDGGWGWIVVFASFMIHVIADGVTYTFGIFYLELLKYFGGSKAMTAWVASIMTGTTYCVGPIASGLTNKYGCRAVTIIGSLLATVGLLLSLVAPNILSLYFTIGILTGLGFGLMYLPAIVSVTCYFEKRRAFATGIAVCGSGIGSAILAPLIEWLINMYGWKGAMLIVSGLVLNCCVCGALFRPIEYYSDCFDDNDVRKPLRDTIITTKSESSKLNALLQIKVTSDVSMLQLEENKNQSECLNSHNEEDEDIFETKSPSRQSFCYNKVDDIQNPDDMNCKNMESTCCASSLYSVQISTNESPSITNCERRRSCSLSPGILSRKDIFYSGSLLNIPQYRSNPSLFNKNAKQASKKRKDDWILFQCLHCSEEMISTFNEMLDFALLKNAVFLLFAISNFLTSIGFFVPHIYMKDRVVGLGIASDEEASFLLSIIGIASTVGRLIFGYLSDHAFINRLWLYSGSLTICGLVTVFSSFANNYFFMSLYCAAFGVSCGTYVSLTSVILVDLLGIEKLTNAFGILLLFQGMASFIGPPIIGWLYDTTDSYDPGFYVAGSMIAISGLMLFFIGFAKYFKSIQKNLTL